MGKRRVWALHFSAECVKWGFVYPHAFKRTMIRKNTLHKILRYFCKTTFFRDFLGSIVQTEHNKNIVMYLMAVE
jgi:hypothetical protein